MKRATGQLVFLQLFHTGQADFFPKSFLFHRPCHMINFALSLRSYKKKKPIRPIIRSKQYERRYKQRAYVHSQMASRINLFCFQA